MLPKNFATVIMLRQYSGRQYPFERGAHGKAFVAAMRESATIAGIDGGDSDAASQIRFHIIESQRRVGVRRPACLAGREGQTARASQDKCPARPIPRAIHRRFLLQARTFTEDTRNGQRAEAARLSMRS